MHDVPAWAGRADFREGAESAAGCRALRSLGLGCGSANGVPTRVRPRASALPTRDVSPSRSATTRSARKKSLAAELRLRDNR